MVRKGNFGTLLCGLCATILSTPAAAAQDRVSATEKGSVLIFSNVEVIWHQPSGTTLQDTFIQITNDYVEDVFVQMYFINGDAPCGMYQECRPYEVDRSTGEICEGDHPGWNWVDNKIWLTHDEPCYWSAMTGLPKGVSPWTVLDPMGRIDPNNPDWRRVRGYIVAYACDAEGQEIRHNHLAGTATIVHYPGSFAWSYNAWAFQAVADEVGQGELLPTSGQLDFDGNEYSQPFDQLLLLFPAAGSAAYTNGRQVRVNTIMTLHPVSADLRQETEGPVATKAHVDIWNMNEVKFSGAYRCVTCWDRQPISEWGNPNHWFLPRLQTDFGKARIDGLASQLCDVDCDPFDELPLGQGYGDVVSEDAALLGVWQQFIPFDNTFPSAAGGNLIGMGVQDAQILFDTQPAPSEKPVDRLIDSISRDRDARSAQRIRR